MKSAYYGNYSYMTRVEESRSRRLARVRQVKRQKLFLIIGLLITILLCLFFSIKAFAGTKERTSGQDKQFTSVMIYCGDSVESLASDYYDVHYSSEDSLAKEIRSINHLGSDDRLIPGNYIIIPYYRQ
ncbi:MAG: hypothetical protein K6E49_04860 [Lachnospiraceae bacterium]|nr:hypothetical protein [Lachnospiraceae bacterium]